MTRRKEKGCCTLAGCVRNPERLCLIVAAGGCLLCMISAFIDRWRVDNNGMQNWEVLFGSTAGGALQKSGMLFKSRTYGLLNVKGQTRSSWKAQTQSACTYRDMNAGVSAFNSLSTIVREWDINACKNSATDACSSTPTTHLSIRCEEYGNMQQAGMLCVSFTMIGIFLVLGSLLAGLQCNKAKVGGVVFGCQFLGSFLIVIFNIVWAVRSDGGFKRIMESAWYPYPVLGAGYYLHLFGGLFMLTASIFYGIIVMPDVTSFDPKQRMIERKEKRLMDAKVNAAKQQHNQQQQLMMNQMVAPPVMMVQQQPMMQMQMQQPQPVMMGGVGGAQVNFGAQAQAQTIGSPAVQQQQGYQMPAAPPAAF